MGSYAIALVQLSLALLVASVGLRAQWRDLLSVMGHPSSLLRAILAINLVGPAVAAAIMMLLPLAPVVKVGILAMAISPLAPLALGKMLKAGSDASYAVGLYVAVLLVSIVSVPITVGLLRILFGGSANVPVGEVARLVLLSGVAPLAAGLILGQLERRLSLDLAAILNRTGVIILIPFVVIILVNSGYDLIKLVGNGVLAAIVCITGAGIAAGHWLGGSGPAHRASLAIATATRHPGMAALIVHRNLDDRTAMVAIVLFLLVGSLMSAIYQLWLKRGAARGRRASAR